MKQSPKVFTWIGIALILIIGGIHVLDAPDCFEDAMYKGWLFYANGAAALVAAYGMFKANDRGWKLGLIIAAGSFIGYVASRTVGLPMIPAEPDEWLEPLGVASLIAEGAFITIFTLTSKKS